MPSTVASYQHWPDAGSTISAAKPVEGFDTHHGLREYEYDPAAESEAKDGDAPKDANAAGANEKKKRDEVAKSSKTETKQEVKFAAPPPAAAQSPWPMMCYPQMPYPYYYPMAIPAPAYYGLPQQNYWGGFGYGMPQEYVCMPAPAIAEKQVKEPKKQAAAEKEEEKEEKKPKGIESRKWQGRTRVEVEQDEKRIAKEEGALAKRKIVPVGLEPDQPVWVVMADGKTRIRTFAEAQEMKGEWHEDPRYKDSLYLVCEPEEKEKPAEKKTEAKDETKGESTKTKKSKGEKDEGKKCSCGK